MKVSDIFLSDMDPKLRVYAWNLFIHFLLIYSFFLKQISIPGLPALL